MLFYSIIEFLNLASSKSLEEVVEPFEFSANKHFEDFFVQEFRDVENVFTEEHCHSHFD